MKLIIESDVSEYYVQTLCLIFFPGSKFKVDEVVTEETPVVRVVTKDIDDSIYAYVTITVGDTTTEGEHTEHIRASREKALKISVGKALFIAGEIKVAFFE